MSMEESSTEIPKTLQPRPFHKQQSCSPPVSSDPDQKPPVRETHPSQVEHDGGFKASTEAQMVVLRTGSDGSSHRSSQKTLQRASNASIASTCPRSTTHFSSDFSGTEEEERYQLPQENTAKGRKRRTSSGSQANSLEKQDITLVHHAPEYRHRVNIIGEPSRYTLDKSTKLTVEHKENVKSPRLESFTTRIQVHPDIEIGNKRETTLTITLALGSPHQDYNYFAKTEAILWDYKHLKELGRTPVPQRNHFNSGHNQKTFSVTLADRERVEKNNSKNLEVIVRVTLCGYPRGQLT